MLRVMMLRVIWRKIVVSMSVYRVGRPPARIDPDALPPHPEPGKTVTFG